jgi:cytochrome oxidase Cu insertion factor (SCO1/SenC/PrrC family)
MKKQLLLLLAIFAIAPLLALPLPSIARQPLVVPISDTATTAKEPVKVGEMAPDFTLASHDGRTISLSASRGKRPVILVFYRGYW